MAPGRIRKMPQNLESCAPISARFFALVFVLIAPGDKRLRFTQGADAR